MWHLGRARFGGVCSTSTYGPFNVVQVAFAFAHAISDEC